MAAQPPATSVVEHEIRVAASPETVFAYFTDPARMVQWMGAEATLDPRPGGICRVAWRATRSHVEAVIAGLPADAGPPPDPDNATGVMSGRFVEVDPPRRLVFTWGWEDEPLAVPPQSTVVEVSLTPEGGETVVHLAHRRLPPDSVDFHRGGWDHYLARLAAAAAGGDPGPDPWQKA